MGSPLVERLSHVAASSGIAVEDDRVQRSYPDLLGRALRIRGALCRGARDLEGERVALLGSPGAAWVEAFFGVILAGGTALPLSPLYPSAELGWFLEDAGARRLLITDDMAAMAAPLVAGRAGVEALRIDELADAPAPPGSAAMDLDPDAAAVLLYTSGTTGKPKGALLTHRNLATHAALLRDAWAFTPEDALLHALPLHHLHGLGISLLTALLAGSRVRMLPRFDAARVIAEIAARRVTSFMAVPTMYQRVFELLDRRGDAAALASFAERARALRLATSGSAALPVTLAARWADLAGAIPLERFGMTEIGVGMSNPLDPAGRRPGWVGKPLPSVEALIVDDRGAPVSCGQGELWVRGPSVFKAYLGRPEATAEAFRDGWFRTGDVAERSDDGHYRLLGRTSVDILKSGGYKLSALEIEEALREHGAVAEVAVVGIPDEAWGERVVAVVVPAPGREDECRTEALRAWAKERLASYKVPREVIVVPALPRNPVGKVVKPDLVRALMAASGDAG